MNTHMTQIHNIQYIYTTINECNFTCMYLCVCDSNHSVQSQFDASLSSTFYKVCKQIKKNC